MDLFLFGLFIVAVVGSVIGFETYIKPKLISLKAKLKEKL